MNFSRFSLECQVFRDKAGFRKTSLAPAALGENGRHSFHSPSLLGVAQIEHRGIRKNAFRDSSMVEQLPVKELVPGSSPGRGAQVRFDPIVSDFSRAAATAAYTGCAVPEGF